jgi:hypothetical protein
MMAIGNKAILRAAKVLRSGRFFEKLVRGSWFVACGRSKG